MTTDELITALKACNPNLERNKCPLNLHDESCEILMLFAADRLEQLQKQLEYARAERDVATKRMIALEQEVANRCD